MPVRFAKSCGLLSLSLLVSVPSILGLTGSRCCRFGRRKISRPHWARPKTDGTETISLPLLHKQFHRHRTRPSATAGRSNPPRPFERNCSPLSAVIPVCATAGRPHPAHSFEHDYSPFAASCLFERHRRLTSRPHTTAIRVQSLVLTAHPHWQPPASVNCGAILVRKCTCKSYRCLSPGCCFTWYDPYPSV